ncbi:MAG: hypothetical protein IRY87_08190 [Acetobacteraceae bacterium]|nr:hypothetical protein [Acetobacteraceae bacterium]
MRGVGRVTSGAAAMVGRSGSRAGGFSVRCGADEVAGSLALGGPAPVGLGVLTLQESSGAAERDAAARQRAESILNELQGLQADILAGGDTAPDRLARLAALETGEDGADPGLREAVQAIVLRAKVELARRGWRAPVSSS